MRFMIYKVHQLRAKVVMLNNRLLYGLSLSILLRDIESLLRDFLSCQVIPGMIVDELERILADLEVAIRKAQINFVEQLRIEGFISRIREKLKVLILNPNNRRISDYSMEKLQSLKYHGYYGKIVITSTNRTVDDQARIMYENIITNGVKYQLETYKKAGQDVVNTFDPTLSRQENIARMAEKINEVGPLNVSKHLADFAKVNAIDVDKKSLSSVRAFKDAAKSAGFSKILDENNCIHIELRQP